MLEPIYVIKRRDLYVTIGRSETDGWFYCLTGNACESAAKTKAPSRLSLLAIADSLGVSVESLSIQKWLIEEVEVPPSEEEKK